MMSVTPASVAYAIIQVCTTFVLFTLCILLIWMHRPPSRYHQSTTGRATSGTWNSSPCTTRSSACSATRTTHSPRTSWANGTCKSPLFPIFCVLFTLLVRFLATRMATRTVRRQFGSPRRQQGPVRMTSPLKGASSEKRPQTVRQCSLTLFYFI